jgi:putative transposase
VSEPERKLLAVAIQGLKLSVARRRKEDPFWQARYYDFNVFTEEKRIEKLEYMHMNPVKRGFVEKSEEWRWSSSRYYAYDEQGSVEIASSWRVRSRKSFYQRS